MAVLDGSAGEERVVGEGVGEAFDLGVEVGDEG